MPDSFIPELEPHCGSWIVVRRSDGQAVFESFNRKRLLKLDQKRYVVLTALTWLGALNRAIETNDLMTTSGIGKGNKCQD